MPNISDLLSTNTANIAANTTAVASAGGSWSEISETTISSSTSYVDFTSLSNTYKHFKLRVENILTNGGSTYYFRFMNGSSVINSPSYYHTHTIAQNHNATNIVQNAQNANNTGFIMQQYNYSVANKYPSFGEIDIFLTTDNPMAISKYQYHTYSGWRSSEHNSIVYYANNTSIDGFRLQATQYFQSGTLKLYGLA
tara:strand:- start:333 stop:920 length:588 start_codon:yes stop_codon:yes gene_type:complete